MQIRTIKKSDKFVKGSKYSLFQTNLGGLKNLYGWDF